jgi:hypothetical protein
MLQIVAQHGRREGQYWAPKLITIQSNASIPKPFSIGQIFIKIFLLTMTNAIDSQNIDLSSWNSNTAHPKQTTIQSNDCISETVQNRKHVHINIFA